MGEANEVLREKWARSALAELTWVACFSRRRCSPSVVRVVVGRSGSAARGGAIPGARHLRGLPVPEAPRRRDDREAGPRKGHVRAPRALAALVSLCDSAASGRWMDSRARHSHCCGRSPSRATCAPISARGRRRGVRRARTAPARACGGAPHRARRPREEARFRPAWRRAWVFPTRDLPRHAHARPSRRTRAGWRIAAAARASVARVKPVRRAISRSSAPTGPARGAGSEVGPRGVRRFGWFSTNISPTTRVGSSSWCARRWRSGARDPGRRSLFGSRCRVRVTPPAVARRALPACGAERVGIARSRMRGVLPHGCWCSRPRCSGGERAARRCSACGMSSASLVQELSGR